MKYWISRKNGVGDTLYELRAEFMKPVPPERPAPYFEVTLYAGATKVVVGQDNHGSNPSIPVEALFELAGDIQGDIPGEVLIKPLDEATKTALKAALKERLEKWEGGA